MDEKILSGYCRAMDASRTVYAELTPEGLEVDCSFGSCPFDRDCPIAKELRQLAPENQ